MLNSKAATPQPPPHSGKLTVIDYVLADMAERAAAGVIKHGMPLQTDNGRDALWDAYQEAMDLCMYLRQMILERYIDETGLRESNAELCNRTGCNEIATVHFMRPWGALGVCENHAIEEHGERLK